MNLQNDYPEILRTATSHIKRKRLTACPEDLINTAYINLIESGNDYSIELFKKLIVRESYKELKHEQSITGIESIGRKQLDKISDCKQCNEVKPMYSFYKNGVYVSQICKDCFLENKKKYYADNIEKCRAIAKKSRDKHSIGKRVVFTEEERRLRQNERMRLRRPCKNPKKEFLLLCQNKQTVRYSINGVEILISLCDKKLFEAHKWSLVKARQKIVKYYISTNINGKTVYLHRLIANPGMGEIVDHIDKNPCNNTRANLRVTSQSINRVNSTVGCEKKSGLPLGVYKYSAPRSKSYWSMIQSSNGNDIFLGSFYTPEEAAAAYNEAVRDVYYEVAC